MLGKLKSRKFWVTFAVSALLLLAKQLGLEVDENAVWGAVAIATGYNFAQGHVDAKKESVASRQTEFTQRLARVEAKLNTEG